LARLKILCTLALGLDQMLVKSLELNLDERSGLLKLALAWKRWTEAEKATHEARVKAVLPDEVPSFAVTKKAGKQIEEWSKPLLRYFPVQEQAYLSVTKGGQIDSSVEKFLGIYQHGYSKKQVFRGRAHSLDGDQYLVIELLFSSDGSVFIRFAFAPLSRNIRLCSGRKYEYSMKKNLPICSVMYSLAKHADIGLRE